MSTHMFGIAQRQKVLGRIPVAIRINAVLLPFVLGAAAIIWANGLLDPHELIKLLVLLIGALIMSLVQASYFLLRTDVPRPLPYGALTLLVALLISAAIASLSAPSTLLAWLGVGGSMSGSAATIVVGVIAFIVAASLRVAGWKPSWSVFSGGFLLILALAAAQRLGWIDLSPGGGAARLFSPLGNEIMVSWFTALTLSVVLSLRDAPWTRWVVVGTGLGWLLWLDRSEVWLVLILALITGQILYVVRQSKTEGVFWSTPGRVALVIALAALLIPIPRASAMPVLVTSSWAQSIEVVKAAWSESMLVGVGQGQWTSLFERIRPVEANLGPLFLLRFDVGANWWFTSAAQEGLLGLGVRLLLFIVLIIHTARLAYYHESRLPDVVLVTAVVGMLSAVHPYGWLVVTGFALVGYASANNYEWSMREKQALGGLMVMMGVVTGMALWWHVPRALGDIAARQSVIASTHEQRVQLLQKAVHRASWVPDYRFALTRARVQLITAQLRDSSTPNKEVQESLASGIAEAKFGTEQWPTMADMWLAQGALYLAIAPATQGADQFAIQAYQEGMKYAPQHPGFPLGIAQVYIHRAEAVPVSGANASTTASLAEYRYEQRRLAAQWLKRALEKKPDDQGILYAYATNLVRAGDVATSLPLFRALAERQPDRVDIGLEYAAVLALAKQYDPAITYAERVSTSDPLYATSRRLLTDWYAAKNDWVSALAAWKSLPVSEQDSVAFRTRLRELQSKAGTTGRR